MAKLPRLNGKELGKIITKLGFVYSHTTGSHMIYKHPDGRKTTIPYHGGEEIGPGLLNKIIKKDCCISRKEFLKYLKWIARNYNNIFLFRLVSINANNVELLHIFGYFLKNIIDDVKEGEKLLEKVNLFKNNAKT